MHFLSEYVDDCRKRHYLLAVSGGVDSMVMLHLFQESGLSFEVAHCNFGLRGEESDGDEMLVGDATARLGVKMHSKLFNTADVAKETGISTQMAARDLRYTWFRELMTDGDFDYLATAHHRGDHAETVLFNITKGTGIAGLHGIRPIMDQLIRPLLDFSKHEIEDFAKQEGLQWREDASNQSNKYSRNLIRNEVVPILKQINPSVEKCIWQSSQRIAQVESWLADEVSRWRERLTRIEEGTVFLSTTELSDHPHRNLILSELIRPFGFSYIEVDDIVDPARERSGRLFSTNRHDLVWDRDQIVITEKQEHPTDSIVIAGVGEYTFVGVTYKVEIINEQDWKLQWSNDLLQADADKIHWPLTMRTWQVGDSIHPLGMKGRKKVSDILIDEKVPLNLKSRQLVLEDQSDIIWLLRRKISHKYKVTDLSRLILVIFKKPD